MTIDSLKFPNIRKNRPSQYTIRSNDGVAMVTPREHLRATKKQRGGGGLTLDIGRFLPQISSINESVDLQISGSNPLLHFSFANAEAAQLSSYLVRQASEKGMPVLYYGTNCSPSDILRLYSTARMGDTSKPFYLNNAKFTEQTVVSPEKTLLNNGLLVTHKKGMSAERFEKIIFTGLRAAKNYEITEGNVLIILDGIASRNLESLCDGGLGDMCHSTNILLHVNTKSGIEYNENGSRKTFLPNFNLLVSDGSLFTQDIAAYANRSLLITNQSKTHHPFYLGFLPRQDTRYQQQIELSNSQ